MTSQHELPVYVVKLPGSIVAFLDLEERCLPDNRNRKSFPIIKGDGWAVRLKPEEVTKFQNHGCTVEPFDPDKIEFSDVILAHV